MSYPTKSTQTFVLKNGETKTYQPDEYIEVKQVFKDDQHFIIKLSEKKELTIPFSEVDHYEQADPHK